MKESIKSTVANLRLSKVMTIIVDDDNKMDTEGINVVHSRGKISLEIDIVRYILLVMDKSLMCILPLSWYCFLQVQCNVCFSFATISDLAPSGYPSPLSFKCTKIF